jgi:hypothetical protein
MSINRILLTIFAGGFALLFLAGAFAMQDFSHYQIILERKPFGEAPPPPPTPAPTPIPAGQSFARQLRLCALIEDDDGEIQVGLMDMQSKNSFYLGVGDIEEGIELISADYEDESAVLKKGAEMAVVSFQSGDIQPLTQAEAQTRLSQRRSGYAERRRRREEARQRRLELAKQRAEEGPQLSGQELEEHLQEYQMEVIRQGLPPLPIPLTEEMDAQLVEEGVLPP